MIAPQTKSTTADDLARVEGALAKNAARRDEVAAELAAIDEAMLAAFDADDMPKARDLEDRQRDLQLAQRLEDRARTTLEARRDVLDDEHRAQKLDRHLREVGREFDHLKATLKTAVEANERVERAIDAAYVDLGAAAVVIPRVAYSRLNRDGFDHWCMANEQALRRREPKRAAPAGVLVRIVGGAVRTALPGNAVAYAKDDIALLPDPEARRLVDRGEAELVDGVVLRPDPNPRRATLPAPDEHGLHSVVFVRPAKGPDGAAYDAPDIASFVPDVALRFVRAGLAEFLPPCPQDCAPVS